jgi:acyl-CoA reductase-like NAD-dependent aldehyde dehydrogenase
MGENDVTSSNFSLTDLDRCLSRETERRERLERRLQSATLSASQAERARRALQIECDGLRRELALLMGDTPPNMTIAREEIFGPCFR